MSFSRKVKKGTKKIYKGAKKIYKGAKVCYRVGATGVDATKFLVPEITSITSIANSAAKAIVATALGAAEFLTNRK